MRAGAIRHKFTLHLRGQKLLMENVTCCSLCITMVGYLMPQEIIRTSVFTIPTGKMFRMPISQCLWRSLATLSPALHRILRQVQMPHCKMHRRTESVDYGGLAYLTTT